MRGVKKEHLPVKTCRVCGRDFAWRKKWERNWEEVTVCSEACRRGTPRGGTGPGMEEVQKVLMQLAARRGGGKSFCPSEAARALVPDPAGEGWRALMPRVRAAGAVLVRQNLLKCTQGGMPVDPEAVSGPIRYQAPDA
ncbi:MAG: DUF3253 domain-containing protein [Verrucomicrobia bacterium]|nr:DUF3253 domain-containing protein [Verrucomicrobiota bacterium]